jgi:hypothetical protein
VADPLGTVPVSGVLIATSGQQMLMAAEQISASPRNVTSAGNPQVSFKVASPEASPCVSGVPSLGTVTALTQPIPGPPSGWPSLTPVSGMGGGEVPFTLPQSLAPRCPTR